MERFRTLTNNFYRGADGILLVYDVNEEVTFTNMKVWLNEIHRYAPDASKVLVGNKIDLDGKRQVEASVAKEYADGLPIPFIETSAKTGHEVENAFHRLLEEVVQRQFKGGSSPGVVRPDAS